MARTIQYFMCTVVVLILATSDTARATTLNVPVKDLILTVNDTGRFQVIAKNVEEEESPTLFFWAQHSDILEIEPPHIQINKSKETKYTIQIHALNAGHSELTSNITNENISVKDVYVRVTVHKYSALDTISTVVGWVYFVAWSVSFYPQIYSNWKRKSVIGLNFDFQGLNILGFVLYFLFNIGLYAIPDIKAEYALRTPRGLNPIQVNDIVFALHASLACLVTIAQCFVYESGDQRVSITARGIISAFLASLVIAAILAGCYVIHWLDFLYYCSYIKLAITLIKYVPQAFMNYRRKSTVGWSIGNIFLDFTGGMLSMLQMVLLSYNYDDWASIFGDPSKFGLGLFSVIFDIFFMFQHYVLYRHTNYEEEGFANERNNS